MFLHARDVAAAEDEPVLAGGGGPAGLPFGTFSRLPRPFPSDDAEAFAGSADDEDDPPRSSSPSPIPLSAPGGFIGPSRFRMIACCTIVHRFVVIQ